MLTALKISEHNFYELLKFLKVTEIEQNQLELQR